LRRISLPPIDPKTLLLGIGVLLVVFFLYRVLKGAAARSVAIPVGIAAGLGITSLGFHPGLGVVGGFVTYWAVAYLVELSIHLATTAVMVLSIALLAYGFYTGEFHF
jgi:hypothetical protein